MGQLCLILSCCSFPTLHTFRDILFFVSLCHRLLCLARSAANVLRLTKSDLIILCSCLGFPSVLIWRCNVLASCPCFPFSIIFAVNCYMIYSTEKQCMDNSIEFKEQLFFLASGWAVCVCVCMCIAVVRFAAVLGLSLCEFVGCCAVLSGRLRRDSPPEIRPVSLEQRLLAVLLTVQARTAQRCSKNLSAAKKHNWEYEALTQKKKP